MVIYMSSKRKKKNKGLPAPIAVENESAVGTEIVDSKILEDADGVNISFAETAEETEAEAPGSAEAEAEAAAEAFEQGDESAETQDEESANDFEKSIDSFTSADAESPYPKKGNLGKIMKYILLAVCGAIFIFSISFIVKDQYSKYMGDKIYEDIQNELGGDSFDFEGSDDGREGIVNLLAADSYMAATPRISEIIANGTEGTKPEGPHTVELEKMRASLESLANINPQVYGWIKVPGTRIDYPIAQSGDNDYYLDHAYTGAYSVNGSIFADFRCSDDAEENYNTVLYGHNITSGSMFHGIEDFFNRETFDEANIYLYTMHGVYIFKAFSIHEAAYDSGYVDTYFETEEDYLSFIKNLEASSDLKAEDIELTAEDRIITLSTCTNGLWSRRYALHGVLVSAITE